MKYLKLIGLALILLASPAVAKESYGPPDPATEEQASIDRMRQQRMYRIEAAETEAQAAKRYDNVRRDAKKWETAYQVLNVADVAQTCYVIKSGRGKELNPFLPKSCEGIALFKGLWGVGHYVIFKNELKRDPYRAKNTAKWSAFIQGAVVGANMRVVF